MNTGSIALGNETEIQLDIFSGRPNPRWTIAGEPLRELERRIEGLPEARERPEPPGLGYRGFLIGKRGQIDLRVFRSVISMRREGRISAFQDQHGLEEYLLDQARQHGYSELLAAKVPEKRGGEAPG